MPLHQMAYKIIPKRQTMLPARELVHKLHKKQKNLTLILQLAVKTKALSFLFILYSLLITFNSNDVIALI